MSKSIIWDIAPEGTTHHSSYGGSLVSPWFQFTDDWHYYMHGEWHRFHRGGSRAHVAPQYMTAKPTKPRHVHADLIKAWADGAEIQVKLITEETWVDTHEPLWTLSREYRIKPEPVAQLPTQSVEELRRDDPSKGEATHYSRHKDHGNKYHKLQGSVWAFWYSGDMMPGRWKVYGPKCQARIAKELQDAILLTPVKSKYQPTREDYLKGAENTRAQYNRRLAKLYAQRDSIQAQIAKLGRTTTLKLQKAARLAEGKL